MNNSRRISTMIFTGENPFAMKMSRLRELFSEPFFWGNIDLIIWAFSVNCAIHEYSYYLLTTPIIIRLLIKLEQQTSSTNMWKAQIFRSLRRKRRTNANWCSPHTFAFSVYYREPTTKRHEQLPHTFRHELCERTKFLERDKASHAIIASA